jgi:hypothetical protein
LDKPCEDCGAFKPDGTLIKGKPLCEFCWVLALSDNSEKKQPVPDLLVMLLDLLFEKGTPPDELSTEWAMEDERTLIHLTWFKDYQVKRYGYTPKRWKEALSFFNTSWKALTEKEGL